LNSFWSYDYKEAAPLGLAYLRSPALAARAEPFQASPVFLALPPERGSVSRNTSPIFSYSPVLEKSLRIVDPGSAN